MRDAASSDPPLFWPGYKSTLKRAPEQQPIVLPLGAAERSVVRTPASLILDRDADLTRQSSAAPLGERIVVSGTVRDEDGRPVRDSLIEIWQCNAAGRYAHDADRHDAPLDPNFHGFGKALTDADGRYRFVTIKPGAYPWGNARNAWRPAHIHFSLFGNAYAQRLITQMYFPGDPLLADDQILASVPEAARERLVGRFDLALAIEGIALGYEFDIVLRGRQSTPMGI